MTARLKKMNRKSKVRRKLDPIPWKYCLLTLVCGLFLVAGFFYAAQQHFASMQYGMENAKLRKQIDELKSEARRFRLAKEMSLSPAGITKSANKLGLQTMTARNIEATSDKRTDKSQLVKIDVKNTKKIETSSSRSKETKEKNKEVTDKKGKNEEKSEANKSVDNKEKVEKLSEKKIQTTKPRTQIAKK